MKVKVGDSKELSVTITKEMVEEFGRLTGDLNPIHFNEEFASNTVFEKPIAHGMLVASLLSNIIGNELPGNGTIYLSQSLEFKAPVYLGDTITGRVTVLNVGRDIELQTQCRNQEGKLVIYGYAKVRLSDE